MEKSSKEQTINRDPTSKKSDKTNKINYYKRPKYMLEDKVMKEENRIFYGYFGGSGGVKD